MVANLKIECWFFYLVLFTDYQLEKRGFAGVLNRLNEGEKIDVFASNSVYLLFQFRFSLYPNYVYSFGVIMAIA